VETQDNKLSHVVSAPREFVGAGGGHDESRQEENECTTSSTRGVQSQRIQWRGFGVAGGRTAPTRLAHHGARERRAVCAPDGALDGQSGCGAHKSGVALGEE